MVYSANHADPATRFPNKHPQNEKKFLPQYATNPSNPSTLRDEPLRKPSEPTGAKAAAATCMGPRTQISAARGGKMSPGIARRAAGDART